MTAKDGDTPSPPILPSSNLNITYLPNRSDDDLGGNNRNPSNSQLLSVSDSRVACIRPQPTPTLKMDPSIFPPDAGGT